MGTLHSMVTWGGGGGGEEGAGSKRLDSFKVFTPHLETVFRKHLCHYPLPPKRNQLPE